MTAVATIMSVGTTAGEQAIARARQILAEDRAMTADETQAARNTLYALMEAGDSLALGIVRAIYQEIDQRTAHRSAEAHVAVAAAAHARADEFQRQRPARWAALSRWMRAALILVDELNGNATAKAILRFVELAADDSTATRDPPTSFEPVKW